MEEKQRLSMGRWIRRLLLRTDVVVIFLLLAVPVGLAAAVEVRIFSILALPGYSVLLSFSAILTAVGITGFSGTQIFYALSIVWYYLVAVVLALVFRRIQRL